MTSRVTRAWLQVAARPGSLPTGRRWAVGRARVAGVPGRLVFVVELLTSELVANAVRHGPGGAIELEAVWGAGHFSVFVTDAGQRLPVVRTAGPEVPGGQGMRLVDRLADAWGVDVHAGGGKTVWFTVTTADAGMNQDR